MPPLPRRRRRGFPRGCASRGAAPPAGLGFAEGCTASPAGGGVRAEFPCLHPSRGYLGPALAHKGLCVGVLSHASGRGGNPELGLGSRGVPRLGAPGWVDHPSPCLGAPS